MIEIFRKIYSKYLAVKIITVSLVAFLSIAIMLPLIKIATLFGINIRENSGLNFEVSLGNVFFFFLFGICSIGVLWLAQKFIHQKKLNELGFKSKLLKNMLLGFVTGAILVIVKFLILILNAETVKYIPAIPQDISTSTYIGYYTYFIIGFISWNSFIEELGTRAYPIEKLKNHMNPHLIFVIMGLLFAVGHFVLNDFSLGYFLSLFIISYNLSLLYFYSGSIWLAVGLHSGINWVGFSFSGNNWKLGALYDIQLYNIPNWIVEYSSFIIQLIFLIFIVFIKQKGYFEKYFSKPKT